MACILSRSLCLIRTNGSYSRIFPTLSCHQNTKKLAYIDALSGKALHLRCSRKVCFASTATENQGSSSLEPGLYVVGTPIGNLKDTSLRCVEILRNVDRILCEDTRHTRHLLDYFNIKTKTESFHLHNENQRQQQVIDLLQHGEAIAMVSDAGMPTVSDPGAQLIKVVASKGIKVIPIPGASAFLSALVASGLTHERFTFCGFIESKVTKRRRQLHELREFQSTLIFYVSPHSLKEAMTDAIEAFGGNRKCCLAREITKIHEEFLRGSLQEIKNEYDNRRPRGEYTLVVEGSKDQKVEMSDAEIIKILKVEFESGSSPSAAAKSVSENFGLPRKRVYELSLIFKRQS